MAVDSRQSLSGREIHDFLTCYTRYDNTSAYGNALMLRGDYTDVIVHIFHEDTRDFYDLERLWADGEKVDLAGLLEE